MAEVTRSYIVRDAGSPSRSGKLWKTYPYTLRALEEAIDDARFRSFSGKPQLVIRAEGRHRIIIRRFENGRQVPIVRPPAGSHPEDGQQHG